MSIWERSLLLVLLRRRLEAERTTDWQVLHKRDRRWFLAQSESHPWLVLRDWLAQWGDTPQSSVGLFVYGLGFTALVLGFVLVAGLVEFMTFERINLLWFMLIAILLPFVWWLGALFFSSAQVPFPLRTLFEHRLPSGAFSTPLMPLLKLTVVTLGQQLSMLFSLGMLMAFLLYLLVTDLAFGWSSTLNLSSELIHQITRIIAWPWKNLWPAAVPSMELVEQTHYFRVAPVSLEQPALFGQWWRFLLMSLLLYVVFPRVISGTFFRYRLNRMQAGVRKSDALISGLWQRLTTELIDHEAQPVEQREPSSAMPIIEDAGVVYKQVLSWGVWPEDTLHAFGQKLGVDNSDIYWANVDSPKKAESTLEALKLLADAPLLLLCKGWEPPTGEVEDYCNALSKLRTHLFLWPVPLQGMDDARQALLIESWRAFMGQLPECFHLIISPLAVEKVDA